jgi:ATP-dependent helicase/nuclease subunit B
MSISEPDAGCERFDAEVRRRSGRRTSLAHLLAVSRPSRDQEATPLHFTLGALHDWRVKLGSARRRCSEWAVLLMEPLRILGFPGVHPLDSAEYQTLVRWRELLTEFAALDRVQPAVDLRGAVTRLGRLAAGTVFQPEGGDPPVQVLGLLEANGLTFDHLWVAGLTSEAWPPAVRAHPLLPLELQRARRMPGADATTELARARTILDRLTRSARHIVASHATRDGDRPIVASSMVATWPEWTPVARAARAADAILPVRPESVPGSSAPSLRTTATVRGGASTLRDQAACPFRAFATHRLNADALDEPHDGLDAAERGQLVHAVLALFWDGLPERTRAHLAAMPGSERTARLERAADQALARVRHWRAGALGDALTALERRRLVDLSSRWLQFEIDQRGDFTVIATEETREMAIGPLRLKGRLDRVDRLPGGRTVVIDYKTGGGAGTGAWLGQRPGEPQLPLYLVATQRDAAAIAFARVRAGETRFVALAEEEGVLPGAKMDWKELYPSWTAMVEAWRVELESVADDFFQGGPRSRRSAATPAATAGSTSCAG